MRRLTLILYGLKNCDSCKKALSQLRAAGHEVEFQDIRTDPLSSSQLADLIASHGNEILLNRKSLTWRKLDEKSQALPTQTLLAQNPTLIKRPVSYNGSVSFVGWNSQVQKACGLLKKGGV